MADPAYVKQLFEAIGGRHYQAIGKIASNWAAFEALLNSLLWRLAEVGDNSGACLTAQIPNSARRIDALVSLVRLRGGSDALIKKINRFWEDTRPLQVSRNRMVHDPWHVDHETFQLQRLEISAEKKLKFEYVPTEIQEIDALVDRIREHIDRFDELAKEIIAGIGPLPDKLPK